MSSRRLRKPDSTICFASRCRTSDLDLVEFRPGHHRSHLALRDLQVDDGAVADIGPAARQAVLIVAVSFEVIAPRLPPEALGNCAALDTHGCNRSEERRVGKEC